jgi:hypothetical protein
VTPEVLLAHLLSLASEENWSSRGRRGNVAWHLCIYFLVSCHSCIMDILIFFFPRALYIPKTRTIPTPFAPRLCPDG